MNFQGTNMQVNTGGIPMQVSVPATFNSNYPVLNMICGLDLIVVRQHIEVFEMMTGIETPNQYSVFDRQGREILFCRERSNFCDRLCCGANRAMEVEIIQRPQNIKVASFVRPFVCTCYCCGRPVGNAYIYDFNGQNERLVGTTYNPYSCCELENQIFGPNQNLLFTANANCCQFRNVGFPVLRPNGSSQGLITKVFSGIQEFFTDADNFTCQFPIDSSPEEKFLLLCLTLMIDLVYFEDNGKNNNRNRNF